MCGPRRTVSPATRRTGDETLPWARQMTQMAQPQYAYAQGADRCDRNCCRVGTIVIGAIGVDFGTSIYAEYRLSSTVRKAANLGSDPFVAILAFPFIPQAMRDHYNQLEIKANAVDHAVTGKATLEATMHSIDLTYASWLIRPDAKLPVGKLESSHHHRLDASGPISGHYRPDG